MTKHIRHNTMLCVPAGILPLVCGQYHTIHCGVDNHESFDNIVGVYLDFLDFGLPSRKLLTYHQSKSNQ